MVDADARPRTDFAKRVSINIFWGQVGQIAQIGLGFLFSIVMARGLGPSLYGIYSLVFAVIGLASMLTSFAFGEILSRYIPRLIREDEGPGRVSYLVRRLFRDRILATLGIGILLYAGRDSLSALFFKQDSISPYFELLILLLLSQVLIELFVGLYTSLLRMKGLFGARTAIQGASLVSALLLFWLIGSTVESALIATLIGSLVGLFLFVRGDGKFWLAASTVPYNVRPIYAFGLVVSLTNFAAFVLGPQFGVVMLSSLLKDSVQVGYYNVALMPIARLSSFMLGGWLPLALPTLSEKWKIGDSNGLAQSWDSFIRLMIMVVVAAFVFLAFNGGVLISGLYSDAFIPSILPFQLGAAFTVLTGLLGRGLALSAMYVLGKQNYVLLLQAICGGLSILLSVLFIPRFGALGAVMAPGISGVVEAYFTIRYVRKCAALGYPAAFALKVVTASVISAILVTFFIKAGNLALLAVAGTAYLLVFLGLLIVLKALSRDDQEMVRRIVSYTVARRC